MPLCVPASDWSAWLDPAQTDANQALAEVTPKPTGWLKAEPVGTEVNNVRNNGPELVRSIPLES